MTNATTARQLAQTVAWELPIEKVIDMMIGLLATMFLDNPDLFQQYMRAYSVEYRRDWKEAERQAMVGAEDARKGGPIPSTGTPRQRKHGARTEYQ